MREESREILEAKERLEKTTRDDVRVAALGARTERLIRENNLAPFIMRALGIRR